MIGDAKPSLLFLHGGGVTSAWWHPQFAAFEPTLRVAAPDLPGHGALAGTPFSFTESVQLVIDLLERERRAPALLVGISLGGYVAMGAAADRPDLTCGLVLSGCTLNLSGPTGIGFWLTGIFLRFRGKDWLEVGTLRGFRKRVAPELLAPVLARGLYLDAAVRAFGQVAGGNFHRLMRGYPHPILVLNGVEDEPNIQAETAFLKAVSTARAHRLDGAGHLANLEKPEAYTGAVGRFAEGLRWT